MKFAGFQPHSFNVISFLFKYISFSRPAKVFVTFTHPSFSHYYSETVKIKKFMNTSNLNIKKILNYHINDSAVGGGGSLLVTVLTGTGAKQNKATT